VVALRDAALAAPLALAVLQQVDRFRSWNASFLILRLLLSTEKFWTGRVLRSAGGRN
jgi:hypothetical protein